MRPVLLVPDLGLRFESRGLGSSYAARETFGEILAAFLASCARHQRPEISFVRILRNTVTTPIKQSQLVLGRHASMFRRPSEPPDRLPLILGECVFLIAFGVEKAHSIFRFWIPPA